MSEQELRAWLRFSRLELSPRAAGALLDRFGDVESIFGASDAELRLVDQLNARRREQVLAPPPAAVDRDLKLLEEQGVTLIPITSADYPASLKNIYDPPIVIYVRGSIVEQDKLSVAMVGSRRASHYGLETAQRIAGDLARRGLTVVSGGARGIDTAAHKGALEAGGRTIAILGCGIDTCYPAENKKLFEAVAGSGAVVSEFPFGAAPEPWRFPPRNRLISGLALGVVVCQCPEASGALITAGYAAEQGKEVFAVPGNIDDDRNRGCHGLIKDGARLVESAADVMTELGLEPGEAEQMALPMESLSESEQKIVALLSLEPVQVDEIIGKCDMPAPMVAGALTILEMKGAIRRLPGNAYVRAL